MFKFNMRRYDDTNMAIMLNKCINLLIDCLFDAENNIEAYDIFYTNYCKKFEASTNNEGSPQLEKYDPFRYEIENSHSWNQKKEKEYTWEMLRVIMIVI